MRTLRSQCFQFTFFASLLAGQWAWGGDFKGNGGSAVQCPGRKLEILDYFEGRARHGREPRFESPDSSAPIAQAWLSRMSALSPLRARIYNEQLATFEAESVFVDAPLSDIADTEAADVLPPDCRLVQVINQNPTLLPAGKKYLIHRELWSQLAPLQRAGLIFHELLYREAKSARTSRGVREINSLLASDEATSLTAGTEIALFRDAGLPWAEIQGIQLDLTQAPESVQVDNRGVIRSALPIDRSYCLCGAFELNLRPQPVTFHPNGSVQSFRFYGPLTFTAGKQVYEFETDPYGTDRMTLFPTGSPQEGPLRRPYSRLSTIANASISASFVGFSEDGPLAFARDATGSIQLNGLEIPIADRSEVRLFSSGQIRQWSWGLAEKRISLASGSVIPAYRTPVLLDESGRLRQLTAGEPGQIRDNRGRLSSFKAKDVLRFDEAGNRIP